MTTSTSRWGSSSGARLAFCLALALTVPARALDEKRVGEAIDKGIDYLLFAIEKEPLPYAGHQAEAGGKEGLLALELYALLVAGVSPEQPTVKKNLELLDGVYGSGGEAGTFVYGLSCYIFALDAAIAQKEADLILDNPKLLGQRQFKDNPAVGREFRPRLEAAVLKLARMHSGRGRWTYHGGGEAYDNSNTQFAVLALGVGAKRGVAISEGVWRKVMDHFVSGQRGTGEEVAGRLTLMSDEEVAARRLRGRGGERVEVEIVKKDGGRVVPAPGEDAGKDGGGKRSGVTQKTRTLEAALVAIPSVGSESVPIHQKGWSYHFQHEQHRNPTWNMTCAGLSSLLLAQESLEGKLQLAELAALNRAIRDGFAWLMAHWGPTSGGYYGMYSLEKVADLAEVKLFGSHDWYDEVASHIVSEQRPDGSWPGGGWEHRRDTAFALLILNRATSLVLMTLEAQNPLARIMVSGRRSNLEDPKDRSWVYVPELDSTIHYPTLLRTIRLRGHPRLVHLLRNIVDSYAPEWKGELVPDMAQMRGLIEDSAARKVIDGYLADITGHDYGDVEAYRKWHRRWQRVMEIGMERKKERTPDLLSYYQHTRKSYPLKKSIVWALEQCKASEAIPFFLQDLAAADPRVRDLAYRAFRSFFLEYPPPFDATARDSVREQQIAAIRDWYTRRQKKE